MGRYILQSRGAIRDLRKVRPEVVALVVPVVVAPPVLVAEESRPFPGQPGFPDERQFVNAPAPEPDPIVAPSYFRMTKVELIEAAIARGIDATGTRPEILGRLAHA
jgi:hypothetical protein